MYKGKWEYLGDGVYAHFDGYGIWLHANSHDKPTDRVYLALDVFESLIDMLNRHRYPGVFKEEQ